MKTMRNAAGILGIACMLIFMGILFENATYQNKDLCMVIAFCMAMFFMIMFLVINGMIERETKENYYREISKVHVRNEG